MNSPIIHLGLNPKSIRAITALSHQIIASVLLLLVFMSPVQAVTVHWRTLVSLTFDDGRTQSLARDILQKHGVQGTFYINSDRIDTVGYLTKAELDKLYADGNEIGGHTIGHVDLAPLSNNDQLAAICNDMQNLISWGYGVYSFAYPFSSTGPSTQSLLQSGCPGLGTYESARAVGGLVSAAECYNCPWSESVPPANPYYVATNNSIAASTTLDELKSYVTQAESNGGGWVPLVFHRICDGCNTLAVSPATLDAFVTWLAARESQYTYVRTVHQVMSGDYPPLPPPPLLGPNLLINPSLEIDANNNGQADCWQRSVYGTNTGSWTRINDSNSAHSGAFSERLNMTSYSNGDRKLLPSMDAGQALGGCAPNLIPGEIYQFTAWYKSTATSSLVVFYLDENGVWQYWRDGTLLNPSAIWKQVVYYPGAIPAGSQAISFGLALNSEGTLITDDYSIAKVLDTPVSADTTPPVIESFTPAGGATASGLVTLAASATDNIAVHQIDFLINGNVVASDTSSPYAVTWNSALLANGNADYTVRAVDDSGNQTVSEIHTLIVQNDKSPPNVSFSQPPSPAAGAIVSDLVVLAATASDNLGVTRVDFLANGTVVGSANTAPFQVTWNSWLTPDGATSLTAKAYDAAGNSASSDAINVTVNNQAGNLLSNPSLEVDANNNGIADCWQRSGFGINTFVWTRINSPGAGHTGNVAESLQVKSRTTGDRKLVQTQEAAGTCAPTVKAGARYSLSSWYKSSIATGLIVYYRSSTGVWTYWQTSANFAPATNWTQATYVTPPVPAGATALSFGMYLNNPGTLITDDYKMSIVP